MKVSRLYGDSSNLFLLIIKVLMWLMRKQSNKHCHSAIFLQIYLDVKNPGKVGEFAETTPITSHIE